MIENIRETFVWTTYGRYLNEQPKKIILKDISDSHLLHIIGHIQLNVDLKNSSKWQRTFNIIHEELLYRTKNNIFIPDYK